MYGGSCDRTSDTWEGMLNLDTSPGASHRIHLSFRVAFCLPRPLGTAAASVLSMYFGTVQSPTTRQQIQRCARYGFGARCSCQRLLPKKSNPFEREA
jgi:hypothetical protein